MPYLYSRRWSNKIKSGNEMMYGKSNMTSLAGLSKPSTLCMLLFQYFKSSHSSWNTLVHLFWPWACSVPRGPRSLMAAWFVWETAWPAGLGKWLSLCMWHWWDHVFNIVLSFGTHYNKDVDLSWLLDFVQRKKAGERPRKQIMKSGWGKWGETSPLRTSTWKEVVVRRMLDSFLKQ